MFHDSQFFHNTKIDLFVKGRALLEVAGQYGGICDLHIRGICDLMYAGCECYQIFEPVLYLIRSVIYPGQTCLHWHCCSLEVKWGLSQFFRQISWIESGIFCMQNSSIQCSILSTKGTPNLLLWAGLVWELSPRSAACYGRIKSLGQLSHPSITFILKYFHFKRTNLESNIILLNLAFLTECELFPEVGMQSGIPPQGRETFFSLP